MEMLIKLSRESPRGELAPVIANTGNVPISTWSFGTGDFQMTCVVKGESRAALGTESKAVPKSSPQRHGGCCARGRDALLAGTLCGATWERLHRHKLLFSWATISASCCD